MKLGFITSILDGWTYEQMMDFASEQGFECVEVACWPEEKAERRYAGVSHIDAERVNQDDEYAAHIMAYAEKAGVEISALAYYPNVMTADKEKRNAAIEHLKNVIRASKKLGVGMVTTFIGRDQTKNVRENLELVKEIWPPIIKLAEVCDVKIAIENCPMLFGEEQWPGGQNLMTTPPIWREQGLHRDVLGVMLLDKLQHRLDAVGVAQCLFRHGLHRRSVADQLEDHLRQRRAGFELVAGDFVHHRAERPLHVLDGLVLPVHRGAHVLVSEPRKFHTPTIDRDRTVSLRSEPSSRATLMGEQPNPWDLLQPQDVTSRHRGAKPLRRYELFGRDQPVIPGVLLFFLSSDVLPIQKHRITMLLVSPT